MKKKKIKSLNIVARRWLQKTHGNTYHSVTIYVNDEILYKPFAYGYGNQYIVTAAEMLENAGYDFERKYKDGSIMDRYSSLCDLIRNTPVFFDSVHDVARKKDL